MAGNVPFAQQPPMSSSGRNLCAVFDDETVATLGASNAYLIARLHDPWIVLQMLRLDGTCARSQPQSSDPESLSRCVTTSTCGVMLRPQCNKTGELSWRVQMAIHFEVPWLSRDCALRDNQ